MKNIYVWGAGEIGGRIVKRLNNNWNVVFVDSNKQLADSNYCGREVISVEEYIKHHSDEFILIAHLQEKESISILQQNNICNYFVYSELPGEFMEPCLRDDFKEYIIKYLGDRNNFVLYGLSIYSIIIDSWLYEKYGIHPYILIPKDFDAGFVDRIKQKYKDLKVIYNINQSNNIEEICACIFNYKEAKDEYAGQTYRLTDIFDCSDKIKSYYNSAIEKFHNIHKGKRCFIVATGPSLKSSDLNLLKSKKELCISMNSIYYAFNKTEWRPNYYMAQDYRVLNTIKQTIDGWPVKANFISNDNEAFWEIKHNRNVYKYHQTYDYYFDRCPKFSEDISWRAYNGSTITYTCIQLAAYMGFKEIYLLGVDFTNGSQKKSMAQPHFYEEDEDKKSYGASYYNVAFTEKTFNAYLAAKQYADSHGMKIFNATRGGELEIFERINFDELF